MVKMMFGKTFIYSLLSMLFAFKAMATEQISVPNLGDVLSELNEQVVFIEGDLKQIGGFWLFSEKNTDIRFSDIALAVPPPDLRMLREGCSIDYGDVSPHLCKIKALAELDISPKEISLIIFELLEVDIPPKSEN